MNENIKKTIFAIVLILATFGLVLGFVIFPTLANIQKNKDVIGKKEAEIKAVDKKIQALSRANQKSSDLEEIIKKTNGLWPDDKSVSNFIVSLEDLAKSGELTFDSLSMSEKTNAKSKTNSIRFSFDTAGRYDQIFGTVSKLEKFDRFNTIDSLSLNTDEQGKISARFIGSIYYGK